MNASAFIRRAAKQTAPEAVEVSEADSRVLGTDRNRYITIGFNLV